MRLKKPKTIVIGLDRLDYRLVERCISLPFHRLLPPCEFAHRMTERSRDRGPPWLKAAWAASELLRPSWLQGEQDLFLAELGLLHRYGHHAPHSRTDGHTLPAVP
jgi:hypothetical protein